MCGVIIAGTHSGSGKTTITLGILAALNRKGHKVQPFKTGPDFIDSGLHKLVTGRTSRNLDLWMCGREYIKECFEKYASDADIAVIEGVMGMYDGNFSTAHLAAELGLPVILVVDGYGMAESAGAIVKGFREYSGEAGKRGSGKVEARLIGVIFNRVASERHYKRLKASVQDVPVLGYLPRDIDFNIPHRHLGLVVAEENPIDADEIDKLAAAVLEHVDVDRIVHDCKSSGERPFATTCEHANAQASGPKIAVAYDNAFCFYYQDNLDMLKSAGAEILPFSPLADASVPDGADALYLGGGYPELYAEQLSRNKSMMESVECFAGEGRPVYAECGGFMYLTEGIYDFDGNLYPMAGVFPFKTKMTKGRMRLGYREAVLREDSILAKKGTSVRGHEFHYSEVVSTEAGKRGSGKVSASGLMQVYAVKDGEENNIGNEGYRIKNTLGSYIHTHFGSDRSIAKNMVDFIKEHNGKNNYRRTRQP